MCLELLWILLGEPDAQNMAAPLPQLHQTLVQVFWSTATHQDQIPPGPKQVTAESVFDISSG